MLMPNQDEKNKLIYSYLDFWQNSDNFKSCGTCGAITFYIHFWLESKIVKLLWEFVLYKFKYTAILWS